MSPETPWRGQGIEFGHPVEEECRKDNSGHVWTTIEVGPIPEKVSVDTLAVCEICHVRRCWSSNESGRCLMAVHHPKGSFHRYPDLSSEPVGGYLEKP